MVVLIDSNVVLDQILKNEGFFESAEDILVLSENGVIDGYVSASAITDIHYIARKAFQDKKQALELIRALTEAVHVATVDEGIVKNAIALGWSDFEDSIQYSAGKNINVDYIVTRDPKGFAESDIATIDPESFLSLIAER
jgi:predicted nucleic acid-binding protein